MFAVKALLAPVFVVGASLAARRFGPRVGGVIGGLPAVAGPILLVYALAHGTDFAARAAGGTLLGLVSLTGFVVVYGRLAQRERWIVCLLAGWLAFGLGTAVFSAASVTAGVALALACAAFALGLLLLPSPRPSDRPSSSPRSRPPAPRSSGPRAPAQPMPALRRRPVSRTRLHPHEEALASASSQVSTPSAMSPPSWDLPLRAACALALVLALTAAAGWLGPRLSGLLAPFPVITTVLATFTHAQRGSEETVRLLRGMLAGFVAFALFCFTLAVSLRGLGVAAAFPLATAVALLTQTAMLIRGSMLARHSTLDRDSMLDRHPIPARDYVPRAPGSPAARESQSAPGPGAQPGPGAPPGSGTAPGSGVAPDSSSPAISATKSP